MGEIFYTIEELTILYHILDDKLKGQKIKIDELQQIITELRKIVMEHERGNISLAGAINSRCDVASDRIDIINKRIDNLENI